MNDKEEMAKAAGSEAREYTARKARRMLSKALKAIDAGLSATVTKVFCNNGEVIEAGPYADHPTRLKAAEMVVVLNDAKPAERHEVNVTGNLAERIRDARERTKDRS